MRNPFSLALFRVGRRSVIRIIITATTTRSSTIVKLMQCFLSFCFRNNITTSCFTLHRLITSILTDPLRRLNAFPVADLLSGKSVGMIILQLPFSPCARYRSEQMNLVVKFNIQGKKMKSIIFLNKETIFLTKQKLEINKLKIYDYINKKYS